LSSKSDDSESKHGDNYTSLLEGVVRKILEPLEGVPLKHVVKLVTGHSVLEFDPLAENNAKLLKQLEEAAKKAGQQANAEGLWSARPNEVGNRIEKHVKRALASEGLIVFDPQTKRGKSKAGYPDIGVEDAQGRTVYLECKTYEPGKENQSFRTFYWKVSKDTKVTKDAFHLVLTYSRERTQELNEQRENRYRFLTWGIYNVEDLPLNLKPEFFASNKAMYTGGALLAHGTCE